MPAAPIQAEADELLRDAEAAPAIPDIDTPDHGGMPPFPAHITMYPGHADQFSPVFSHKNSVPVIIELHPFLPV
jgi:hypothetical protein